MSESSSAFSSAVSGLFRMVLDPEAVIDVVAALDELGEGEVSEAELAELRAQLEVAEALSARVQAKQPAPPVEYLLLSSEQRILVAADASRLFDRIAVSTSPGNCLRLKDAEAHSELEQALRTLPPGGLRFMPVHLADDTPLVTLAVARTADPPSDRGVEFMVAGKQSASWSEALESSLKEFKLTPAETRVLKALRTDQSASELAARLGVAENTVRTQIKALLAKIGVSKQAELVRFREEAVRLSTVIVEQMRLAIADRDVANPKFFPSGRPRPPRNTVVLANGRRVSYREFGAPDGSVIVVLHGAHSGSMIPEGYNPGAHAQHLRLIAPDRPGFGESSPSRADLTIQDAAAETRELLDRLRVRRYAILSLAAASATAVELAKSDARATSLTLCSPHFGASPLPNTKPGFGLLMQRNLFERAPWLLERVSRVMWASMSWESMRKISRSLLRRSPGDWRQLQDTDLDIYVADVVLDARQNPPDGQMWEARALSQYRLDLTGLTAPITLMLGEDDTITDKAGMAELFGAPDRARIVTAPGGHLFYYQDWPNVLRVAAGA